MGEGSSGGFNVSITPRVLTRLINEKDSREGKKRRAPRRASSPGRPPSPGALPRPPASVLTRQPPAPAAPAVERNRNRELSVAVASSHAVSEMLYKKEAEEHARVKAMAEELHRKEFVSIPKPLACKVERQACLECYQANTKDPLAVLKCAEVVKNFSRCAEKAYQLAQGTVVNPSGQWAILVDCWRVSVPDYDDWNWKTLVIILTSQ
eukprot:jgi/Mesvir1/29123/Mv18426-RA.1